jgi:hypothetical protein
MENKITPEIRNIVRQKDNGNQSRVKRTPDYYLLWGLVLILLAFNLILALFLLSVRMQLETYRQTFGTRLVQAGTILENIKGGRIDYVANIDQTIPIDVEVPLDYQVNVPVSMVIPINTTVSIPILGPGSPTIDVPISTNVPINTTITVPINMSVPIKTNMPIKMAIPVSINISDTFLVNILDQAQVLMAQLNLDLGGFTPGPSQTPKLITP